MQNEYVRSLRTTLDFLLKEGEALLTDGQVDPICEIAGILKSFENGPAIIFNKIKGYPGIRNVGNLFARIEREARMFGVNNPGELKLKCRGALKNPLPASIVEEAPCQEVVIKDNFDVSKILPIIKHTNFDGARILGGGVVLAMGEYYNSGSDLSFKRLSFRDRDWASIAVERTSHLGVIRFTKHRKDHIPLTVNIGVPPSVMTVAAVLFPRTIVPIGSDEVGMAGALQEFPVELCRAKTVDAYAIAEAEWVLEGYYLPDRVWESEEAERLGKQGVAPLMPEWTRYMGKAYMHRKFQVTAITHRKDRPYFFTPLADSFETDNMALPWREACFLELADRIAPGLAVDVSVPYGLGWGSGVVFKVKKRGLADEGLQRNILLAALGAQHGLRLAIAVDDDIDIHNADDLLWAISTRSGPPRSFIRGAPGSAGQALQPAEAHEQAGWTGFFGGIGIDATIPFGIKDKFKRAKYPVDLVKLEKFFNPESIARAKAQQSEYARTLAKMGG